MAYYRRRLRLAPVAQWIEQRFPKPLVASSILAGGAKDFGDLANCGLVSTNCPEPCCPTVAQTRTTGRARQGSAEAARKRL